MGKRKKAAKADSSLVIFPVAKVEGKRGYVHLVYDRDEELRLIEAAVAAGMVRAIPIVVGDWKSRRIPTQACSVWRKQARSVRAQKSI